MPANLPSHIVNHIKILNEIPSLQEQLTYLGFSTDMSVVSIVTSYLENWVVCKSHNPLIQHIKPGTVSQFDKSISTSSLVKSTFLRETQDNTHLVRIKGEMNTPAFPTTLTHPIYHTNGNIFGLLCALGPVSTSRNSGKLKDIYQFHSEHITTSIALVERFEELEHRLRIEREIAEKHATYMAVLGHDLRNPVGTIRMCSDIIKKAQPNPVILKNADLIKSSSYRMQELIDSMLDTAQSKFGDGIKIEKKIDNVFLANSLYHVVEEIKAINSIQIKTSLKLTEPVNCDAQRLAQLLSNLLSNAVNHGDGQQISMVVKTTKKNFLLTVANTGPIIPSTKIKKIFEPYFSEHAANNKNGLGLGLYISSQIAQSHGGSLKVKSNKEETVFKLSIPL